jgi:hypothetical protein
MTGVDDASASRTERPSLTELADVLLATATSLSEAGARRAPSYMDRSLRGVTG